uniref:Uncharacterized protein n=1 Tax=Eutreptiella gymnastica TaxID=73025 RepID=A0A7S4GCQ8_9EUGL
MGPRPPSLASKRRSLASEWTPNERDRYGLPLCPNMRLTIWTSPHLCDGALSCAPPDDSGKGGRGSHIVVKRGREYPSPNMSSKRMRGIPWTADVGSMPLRER